MVHLRLVVPEQKVSEALGVLEESPSVCNLVELSQAARKPDGSLVICDVAREDASLIIDRLRSLGIEEHGSISIDRLDTSLADAVAKAERAAPGSPSDAVIWEQVEHETHESASLSVSFVLFMVLSMLIAAVGIFLDSEILVIGAMILGPEFGPIAGFCVAAVGKRKGLIRRSATALLVGFPAGITAVFLTTLIFKATGITPEHFTDADHALSNVISNQDFLTFFVAFCAGVAGMLSLTTAKSSTLVGVLVSVTTIPAAANIGVAAAYQDWPSWRGSQVMLGVNLGSILLAGLLTLAVQRLLFLRRKRLEQAR